MITFDIGKLSTMSHVNNHKTIFLIEDDEDDQQFFTDALREITDTTLFGIANNGKEALEKLANSTILPDIIFTDIHMPVMNGIECLTQLRSNPRTENIAVVILSSASQHIEIATSLHVTTYIIKPPGSQLLRDKIEHAINLALVPQKSLF